MGRCLGDRFYPLKLKRREGNPLRLGTKHLPNFLYTLPKITAIILIIIFIYCNKKDKEPPYVEITSPKDSSLFSGGLKIEVVVIDSSKIKDVFLYLDYNLFSNDTSHPYEFNIKFDTPFIWHKIFAKAYDIYNNEGISKEINVFYLGKRKENVYHGDISFNPYSEYRINIFANVKDSIIGEILVKNNENFPLFLLLSKDNDTIIKLSDFNYGKIEEEIKEGGKYYLVFKNNSLRNKEVWMRFYLATD
ncbi:MAG: Ig-like domain-containing protein [candidate division WOR-3 bacterium]|nr:Ig-like domain-containing protein [candidate division WOR-3 bacterium]